jgi:hypothetical protein
VPFARKSFAPSCLPGGVLTVAAYAEYGGNRSVLPDAPQLRGLRQSDAKYLLMRKAQPGLPHLAGKPDKVTLRRFKTKFRFLPHRVEWGLGGK